MVQMAWMDAGEILAFQCTRTSLTRSYSLSQRPRAAGQLPGSLLRHSRRNWSWSSLRDTFIRHCGLREAPQAQSRRRRRSSRAGRASADTSSTASGSDKRACGHSTNLTRRWRCDGERRRSGRRGRESAELRSAAEWQGCWGCLNYVFVQITSTLCLLFFRESSDIMVSEEARDLQSCRKGSRAPPRDLCLVPASESSPLLALNSLHPPHRTRNPATGCTCL
jgi:hypothetical protein